MSRERPPALVLASTSRYRAELLARLGVPFVAAAPDCDEDAYKAAGIAPRELAETLALLKAQSLRAAHPDAAILGGDQVASIDDTILSKPGTEAAACAQLARLAGRTHTLITAVALLRGERILRHTDVTRLTMRPLSPEQIARYVAADQPLDCGGSYRLESLGIALFSRIESADHTAIVGLPLLALTAMLGEIGIVIP
ncbi:MAG: nucleoside triphosphate pyrophosphatase [Byssovorax sp.]